MRQRGDHQVVIVGGGFGGLYAARSLAEAPVGVTLLDRRNFHLFQPLLYQVATAALSPADIASPLRHVLKRQANAQVILEEAVDFDLRERRVIGRQGALHYDTLVVAAGSENHYFGRDDWAARAPGLKTLEDALAIRRRILLAFETAERESDPRRREAWLTFVIAGAGPTGVELAGAISEIAQDTLKHEFRHIESRRARIVLLDRVDRVLPAYLPELSRKAEKALKARGVIVRTGTKVIDIREDRLVVKPPDGGEESIPSRTILWTAGVRANSLGKKLADAAGVPLEKDGRIPVGPDLTLAGHPEVLVIGDLASALQDGRPLPGTAPVAMQQGRYAASVIRRRLGKSPEVPPFRYRHRGDMATIGRAAAVAHMGGLRFNGYPAWLAWLFVHLLYIVEFENRVLVLVQWAWNYLTYNRGARLITGEDRPTEL